MQTLIRVFYNKITLELLGTVTPTDDSELIDIHDKLTDNPDEDYEDITNDEYLNNCLLNGLPDPDTLVNYILSKQSN